MTRMMTFAWLAIGIAVLANVVANITLKVAMTSAGEKAGVTAFSSALSTGTFWLGVLSAGVLLLSYLYAIKSIPVGTAYVVTTSLAMVGIAFAENRFFGTAITAPKLFGILLVIAGIAVISRQ